ncbi:peptidase M23 [Paraburkholderia phymatum]|uniref:Peptidase M23 n=1 Tax=Paraburkholderia phymatum TaxID=148447 RepID=A0ACC6TX89_9BURK
MDTIDKFELAHGTFPIAFDRRWHCGVHLMPKMQVEKVHAIADGEVIAYRVCQRAYDGGSGRPDSNAGFVLLKHVTETGDGRGMTFYSLYMHLLDLGSYASIGADANLIPEFLRLPTASDARSIAPAESGTSRKVRRKQVLGWVGGCHGQSHLHFEIFMTRDDFDAYFDRTQPGNITTTHLCDNGCWGHTYFVIPVGRAFHALPPTADAQGKLHGIEFVRRQSGQNEQPLYVETYFQKGNRYTNVWGVSSDGRKNLLTETPICEKSYEYEMYKRVTALYPTCPSDGYDLLRFGRTLFTPIASSPAEDRSQTRESDQRETWVRVAFAAQQDGYIDISDTTIQKLSDANFPYFMGWQKISEANSPFNDDGLCDINALKNILRDAAVHQIPDEISSIDEYRKEDALVRYVRTTAGVRTKLRGFICEAPSEWDSTHNDERHKKLMNEGEFYYKNEAGYKKYIDLLRSFQFWDKTGLPTDQKLWFFHPLAFIRHFRKCEWLSKDELASTFPRYMFYSSTGNPRTAITTNNSTYAITKAEARNRIMHHSAALNACIRKYIGHDKKRTALFLAQILLETAQWRNPGGSKRLMHEWRFGQYSLANPATQYYTAFYGRGIMQLTWAGNYKAYGQYRSFPPHSGSYVERIPHIPPRIASASRHYSANPADGGELMVWSPRYDPDIVGEDPYSACDSGGFYWISKSFSEGMNINRVADREYSPSNVGLINRLVNGGGNGYYERQCYSAYILDVLGDAGDHYESQLITLPAPKSAVLANLLPPE